MKPWGYHLMIEAGACDVEVIRDGSKLFAWVTDLCREIDMKAYGDPLIERFASHDPEKGGFTVVQLIETSNITGHFVDATGDAYLDVFSCKEFNPYDVMEHVAKWLKPKFVDATLMSRVAPTGDPETEQPHSGQYSFIVTPEENEDV